MTSLNLSGKPGERWDNISVVKSLNLTPVLLQLPGKIITLQVSYRIFYFTEGSRDQFCRPNWSKEPEEK